jgi:hypothetical protein
VDKLFEVKAPVTLTFDLVTTKSIGVIYYSWLTSMPNMKTVGQRNLSYWADKKKPTDSRTAGRRTAWQPDSYNFVVRGYNNYKIYLIHSNDRSSQSYKSSWNNHCSLYIFHRVDMIDLHKHLGLVGLCVRYLVLHHFSVYTIFLNLTKYLESNSVGVRYLLTQILLKVKTGWC